MLWVVQFIIVLGFVSETLAAYGDLRIREGGDSGLLEFNVGNDEWRPICRDGFDDDAGDVACRQLGYLESSDVYTYSGGGSKVCDVICYGDEDELADCYISLDYTCSTYCEVVGITCTDGLTVAAIIAVVFGSLIFVAVIVTITILCICCLHPSCPCYYNKKSRARATTVATQPTPQVVTTVTTTRDVKYQQAPPAYTPDPGYQPYPTEAPGPGYQPYPTEAPDPGYQPYPTEAPGPGYQPYPTEAPSPGYQPYPTEAPDPGYQPYPKEAPDLGYQQYPTEAPPPAEYCNY